MALVIPSTGADAKLLVGNNISTQDGSTISPDQNYVKNASFTSNLVTGWATYVDAAAVTPADGTGGAANVTFAAQAGSLVRGTQSGRLTKDAVNRQGQGVAYAFTIDAADAGRPVSIAFDFLASANYVAGDVGVYLYDVTNATLITPASVTVAAGKGVFRAFFVASTSVSYRLILHVASVSALAWTLDTDNFMVGPQTQLLGAAITDPQVYTPTETNKGTAVYGGSWNWSQTGPYIEIIGVLATTTAGSAAGVYQFSAPPGVTLADGTPCVGSWGTRFNAAAGYLTLEKTPGANTFRVLINGSAADTALLFPSVGNAQVYVYVKARVSNWSSNVTMAERALEEYASNSNATSAASDTTSFVNGIAGSLVPNGAVGTAYTRRVRYQTTIQATDSHALEVDQGAGQWVLAASRLPAFIAQGTNTYGIQVVQINSTDVDFIFSSGGYTANNATYAGNGLAWSGLSTWRWRVRKVSSGAAIGGAIGARNVVGDVSGTAVPAGYIGEVVANVLATDRVEASPAVGTNFTITGSTASIATGGEYQVSVYGVGRLNSTSALQVLEYAAVSVSGTYTTLGDAYVLLTPGTIGDSQQSLNWTFTLRCSAACSFNLVFRHSAWKAGAPGTPTSIGIYNPRVVVRRIA